MTMPIKHKHPCSKGLHLLGQGCDYCWWRSCWKVTKTQLSFLKYNTQKMIPSFLIIGHKQRQGDRKRGQVTSFNRVWTKSSIQVLGKPFTYNTTQHKNKHQDNWHFPTKEQKDPRTEEEEKQAKMAERWKEKGKVEHWTGSIIYSWTRRQIWLWKSVGVSNLTSNLI